MQTDQETDQENAAETDQDNTAETDQEMAAETDQENPEAETDTAEKDQGEEEQGEEEQAEEGSEEEVGCQRYSSSEIDALEIDPDIIQEISDFNEAYTLREKGYRIIDKIGEGTFSSVYLAVDEKHGEVNCLTQVCQ
jgi:hypothetical protein